ncbi:MAG: glycosyltransferase [Planctomycetes bacterium]|nr:glycosyltransferase [Planctomycetota bacterium]
MEDSSLKPVFSIITPSYNMLGYLKRCCASVADQQSVTFEQMVIDAESDDGTIAWLRENKQIISVVEKDKGMYDAINKGLLLAKGEILSYLNCDEQYLPGTLNFVQEYFEKHPEIDILFGNMLLVRPDGSLIAYRKGFQPRWFYIISSHLYVFSCTMFFRKKIITDGFRFNNSLKAIGDHDFVVRLLRHGYRAVHARRYLAAFTMTGNNMGKSENATDERRLAMAANKWTRFLRYPLNIARIIEKIISGAYWEKMPLVYSVYDSTDSVKRREFRVQRASFRWPTE